METSSQKGEEVRSKNGGQKVPPQGQIHWGKGEPKQKKKTTDGKNGEKRPKTIKLAIDFPTKKKGQLRK